MFSSFLERSQMSEVFYHSVIHGLGFSFALRYRGNEAKNNKTRFFYVLYFDKAWIFHQLECAQGPIYILNNNIEFGIH